MIVDGCLDRAGTRKLALRREGVAILGLGQVLCRAKPNLRNWLSLTDVGQGNSSDDAYWKAVKGDIWSNQSFRNGKTCHAFADSPPINISVKLLSLSMAEYHLVLSYLLSRSTKDSTVTAKQCHAWGSREMALIIRKRISLPWSAFEYAKWSYHFSICQLCVASGFFLFNSSVVCMHRLI